jgi:hypothetical protein
MKIPTVTRAAQKRTLHQIPSTSNVDAAKIIDEVEKTLTDLGTWIADTQRHELTQRAEWEGQNDDGRKHEKDYGRPVFPYEGAADTRNRLADMSIDELVQLKIIAFFNASMRTIAMEANDVDAAGRVQTLLHYEIKQRLLSELWQELNFATTWAETYGHAVLGVTWQESFTTGLAKIGIEDLAAALATQMQQAAQMEMEMDPTLAGTEMGEAAPIMIEDAFALVESFLMDKEDQVGQQTLVDLILQLYPSLPEPRARRVLNRLRTEGVDEFRVPVARPGRPTVKAYMPGFDIFYPWAGANADENPWTAVQEMLWEPDLRAKEKSEGWDPIFIERLLDHGPGPCVDQASIEARVHGTATSPGSMISSRQTINRYQSDRERSQLQYAVLRVHVKGIDEDGIPALHEIVMHPAISSGKQGVIAVNRVLDYYHEGGCFVTLRREYKIRSAWESRGIPELAQTTQMEMKVDRDSMMDRTALNTLPPITVEGSSQMGKGERYEPLGIRPGGNVITPRTSRAPEMMRLPAYSPSDAIFKIVARDNANLLGLLNADLPAEKISIHRQWLVTGYLIQVRALVLRILSLDQQFMDPIQVSRVIGSGEMPYTVTREEIAGQYDVHLTFDVKSLDMDWLKERLAVLKEAVQFDRSGAFKDVPVMKYLVAAVDPNLADLAIADVESAREAEVEDEKKAIGTLLSGIEIKPPAGANASVRLETDRAELANNPVVNQRFQADPWFQRMMERRMAKWEFDLQQRENAQTGRDGWVPAMDDLAAEQQTAESQPAL